MQIGSKVGTHSQTCSRRICIVRCFDMAMAVMMVMVMVIMVACKKKGA